MDVSVIIVSYNTATQLERCLASVFDKTEGLRFEVIVADNASSDGSPNLVRTLFPHVHLLVNSENIGFGAASNGAVKEATGKYLFFLNPDAELRNNAIKMFFDFMEECRGILVGAIGGQLLNNEGRLIHSSGTFVDVGRDLHWRYKALARKLWRGARTGTAIREWKGLDRSTSCMKVDYVTGADLFISRQLFTGLGGFNEAYFMYAEEMDLQYRLMTQGYQCFIMRGPEIRHEVGASFSVPNRRRIMMTVGLLTFVRLRYGRSTYLVYKTGLLLVIALEWLADRCRREYSSSEGLSYFRKVFKEEFK